MGKWMINCKEASRLMSESQDRKLSFSEKMLLYFHLFMCKVCQCVDNQIKGIQSLICSKCDCSEDFFNEDSCLSDECSDQIKSSLNNLPE